MNTTIQNNEVAVASELRSNGTSPINNAGEGGIDTPTMYFEDWAVDPFSLAKEIDVFSSFAGVDEDVPNANANSNLASFPPPPLPGTAMGKSSNAPTEGDSVAPKKIAANYRSRKRNHKQTTNSGGETAADLSTKNASSTKKKADSIPVSRRKKKPKGMPKRPLSAYNLYFQAERTNIIANQQEGNGPRIGFEGLGKIIGKKWRDLTSGDKKEYGKLAEKDSERYRKEMDAYHKKKQKRFEEEDKRAASHTPILSGMPHSATSTQGSPFDMRFSKGHGSVQIVTVGGEGVGNSVVFTHPPESMVSAITSLPHRSNPISYRPIHVDQPPPLSRQALQHNSILEALNLTSGGGGAVPGTAPPNYFPQTGVAGGTEPSSYTVGNNRNDNCPMPPGMEVVLSDRHGIDRKYRVQYTCYSMTRENANRYIESLTGGNNNLNSNLTTSTLPAAAPAAMGLNREYDEWDGVMR